MRAVTVVTFGTFDLFHLGHVRLLARAAAYGPVHVGVSSDEFTRRKKGRAPVFGQDARLEIVGACRFVQEVFLEESFELKRSYLERARAGTLVMGDDWTGRFDELADICEVVYLPRTADISSTGLLNSIRGQADSSELVRTAGIAVG